MKRCQPGYLLNLQIGCLIIASENCTVVNIQALVKRGGLKIASSGAVHKDLINFIFAIVTYNNNKCFALL